MIWETGKRQFMKIMPRRKGKGGFLEEAFETNEQVSGTSGAFRWTPFPASERGWERNNEGMDKKKRKRRNIFLIPGTGKESFKTARSFHISVGGQGEERGKEC